MGGQLPPHTKKTEVGAWELVMDLSIVAFAKNLC